MRLGSLVCGLLINIIFNGFFISSMGLESKPCREILHIRYMHIMRVLFCVFCVSPLPSLHATDNSIFTFTLYFKYFLRILCTFYLSTFCFSYFLLLLMSFYC
jgi:hypothetical protein